MKSDTEKLLNWAKECVEKVPYLKTVYDTYVYNDITTVLHRLCLNMYVELLSKNEIASIIYNGDSPLREYSSNEAIINILYLTELNNLTLDIVIEKYWKPQSSSKIENLWEI